MFTFTGKFIGSYRPLHNNLGKVSIKQIECVNDENIKTKYALEIISSSIRNMQSVLKYYNKKGIDLIPTITELEEIKKHTKKEKNILIFEARAKQIYYKSFNQIIKNNDFKFNKRTVNPPLDYINAIMSYGYAILYGIIENDIYKSNLSISLPFIYGLTRNPDGLQYDIADIFKPVVIDRLIFRMINKKQITKEDFDCTNKGVLLNKQGVKKFLVEIEDEMKSTIKINKQKKSYRSIINKEIIKIEKSIINGTPYKGYIMRW